MEKAVFDAMLRQDLSSFIAKTFTSVDPASVYLHNWHIDLLADRLQMAERGEITRLIINVPPRSLKSVCVSVAWPAWLLGRNPSARIMAASYSQILSIKHSADCRLLMSSAWYKRVFPKTVLSRDQNEKFKFVTTNRGFRFATSVGGTATGEGGDFLIVDDPHNPLQAASESQRKQAIEWFDQTFMTRLNNKKKGVIIVVMQRLHVDDLTGHLLEKSGKWEHLCLPAIAPAKTIYHFGGRQIIRPEGDILHKEREGENELKRAMEDLGSYGFAAQYQQQPLMKDGGMVEIKWFGRFNSCPSNGKIIQSWDTAIKAGSNNDYSVCTTWCEGDNGYYLVDVMAKRMEYPELKRNFISLYDKWNPEAVLVEDKASGQSLLQDIKRETKIPVIAIGATSDKISRFAAVTAMIEAGKVLLPQRSAWLADFEMQLLAFPNGSHDDMVDSFSQFLNWAKNRKKATPTIRGL